MKKILWVLLPLLLLSACAVEEAPEVTAPPIIEVEIPYEKPVRELPYEGVTMTFQSVWWEDEPQAQVLVQAAQFFEKQTGAVVQILWPEEAGQQADISQVYASQVETIAPESVLDLTAFAEKTDFAEKSHEALRNRIIEQFGFLGAVAQVPYLGGVYYNADVFNQCEIEQLPRTWEEFMDTAEILRLNGWEPLTLDKEDAVTAMELHLRRSIGSEEMLKFMGKSAHWHFDQAVIDAMEQVMIFAQSGYMTYGTPADYPAGQNKMALSNSAMMVGTNADCAAVEEATAMDLNWGVFPYPGQLESGTWASADVLVVSKGCENPQAAFDFVMLLATGEFDQLRANIMRGIPADPTNDSPVAGAVEAFRAALPADLGIFGSKQTDAAVKLWSGWYDKANRYAIALERSK